MELSHNKNHLLSQVTQTTITVKTVYRYTLTMATGTTTIVSTKEDTSANEEVRYVALIAVVHTANRRPHFNMSVKLHSLLLQEKHPSRLHPMTVRTHRYKTQRTQMLCFQYSCRCTHDVKQ